LLQNEDIVKGGKGCWNYTTAQNCPDELQCMTVAC